jgi:anhydro-N-acetylmuramic acid kinase
MPNDANPRERIIAGAMSGTSADGVDVALTRITGRGTSMSAQLIHHHHRPYDAATRTEIFAFRGGDASCNLARLAKLGRTISLTYATAINEALGASHLSAKDLAAVAAHGQTLYHGPPDTIQWFDPSLVAAEVGCAVVSDFRRADLAAGGQGAPLVPFADYILFRHPTKNRVLLNLGGIANIAWLPAGGTPRDTIGFDTGPANCVIDHLARQNRVSDGFDRDGKLSLAGTSHFATAFAAIRLWTLVFTPPPKSADIPEMIAAFERARDATAPSLSLADQMATACEMAAMGVALALDHLPARPDEIIASGGGVENPRLTREIAAHTKLPVHRADAFGVDPQAKEALAFALLAAATLDGEPSNVPSVTGAKRSVVLGSITPKP